MIIFISYSSTSLVALLISVYNQFFISFCSYLRL
uniref:Uncharacterized protein n=1 Tax=Rhizophora mucronata TaxID=61149 RepID=A0A2P2PWX8_RHIMU